MDTVAGRALDTFVHNGLPWMGKKAVEMGRYYCSEVLRNPKIQKKAIDRLNPMIQNVGSQALDQLSTKIRPKKNYKTNRKDLDGGAIDITRPLENYQNLGLDGPYQGIGIQVNSLLCWKLSLVGGFPLDSLAKSGFPSFHMQDSLTKKWIPPYVISVNLHI